MKSYKFKIRQRFSACNVGDSFIVLTGDGENVANSKSGEILNIEQE